MSLPANLDQMKTGEVAEIARQRGIPDVEKMNKQQMIEALTGQGGGQGQGGQGGGSQAQGGQDGDGQGGGKGGGQGLPENLEQMKTGEVAEIARQRGIPDVEKMNKQQMIDALVGQGSGG
jgi:transcription termination factor Rho